MHASDAVDGREVRRLGGITVSVDIEELAAHLERQRKNAVKEQYDARATHATTAFLLCFFLGYLGAHRFYLGQWRSGLAHFVIFALGVAGVVGGLIASAPTNAALLIVGGVLILASLIWEIIDLSRIDNEIHQRNTLLAEGLIAGALLAENAPLEGVAAKPEQPARASATQASPAGVASAGAITAADLAEARALADQGGQAAISYHEATNFSDSGTANEQAGAVAREEPTAVTERNVVTEPLPAPAPAAPVSEVDSVTQPEAPSVTLDGAEADRASGPSAGEAFGLGAAALGAAGLGFGVYEAAHAHDATSVEPETASPEPAAQWDAPTQPAQEPAAHWGATEQEPAAQESTAQWSEPATAGWAEAVAPAREATVGAVDATDAGAPESIAPVSDIAFTSAAPAFITMPGDPTTAPASSAWMEDAYTAPAADATDADVATEPNIPLYVTPQEAAPVYQPPAAPEPPAESYVPPLPDVYSASAPHPESYRPSWEAPTAPATPAAEPEALAGLAGLGAVAGAGALAEYGFARHAEEPTIAPEAAVTEPALESAPAPEPAPVAEPDVAAEPAAPRMKRIRVKRRIVVEGQVVREEVVEREVPADADMAAEARRIQEELASADTASSDEIARLAHLSPDAEIEVHRNIEGLDPQH